MRLEKRNGSDESRFAPLSTPAFPIKPLAKELMRLTKAEIRHATNTKTVPAERVAKRLESSLTHCNI